MGTDERWVNWRSAWQRGGIVIPLAVGSFLLLVALAAARTDWPEWPASPPENFSQSGIDRARRPAVAAGPSGRMVVVWRDQLGLGSPGWLYVRLTQDRGLTWSAPEVVTSTTEEIFPPDALIAGGRHFVTWAQRRANNRIAVYEAEKAAGWSTHQIPGPASDAPAHPHLAVAGAWIYVVFSANRSPGAPTDLLYSYRPLTGTTWPTATVFFTHTAFLGGSQFPKIASDPDGTTLHVVWEEKRSAFERSILYASGTVAASGAVTWGPPITLSEGITLSKNPDIVVDSTGDVHVVWGESTDQGQYVRYARYDADAGRWLLPAVRLPDIPMQLNEIDPADLAPHISVFERNQTRACVVWHGFRRGDASEAEEVWISCSTDEGATWSIPNNVSRSPGVVSIMPWAAFDDVGHLYVVWEERTQTVGSDTFYEVFACQGFNRTVFLPLVMQGG